MNQNIEFYNNNAKWYEQNISNVNITPQLELFLDKIPRGGKILDAGCGTGRDTLEMLKRGYAVSAFDGSTELAKIASDYAGIDVIVDTFENVKLPNDYYDGIWCMASLLHVHRNNMVDVMNKLYNSLRHGGHMYCSYKSRNDDFEKGGRQFTCYNIETINDVVNKTNFIIECGWENTDERDSWLNVILKK